MKNRLPYRAIWVSFLEYEQMDFSSAAAFEAQWAAMVQNAKAIGMNTIIAHVRPFADALHKSTLYPASHLLCGVRGCMPGYDPLAIMVDVAHAHGMALEAWLNPYRVLSGARPMPLAKNETAARWLAEDTGKKTRRVLLWDGAVYFNPASAEVQALIADGAEEIIANYAVDGLHIDDYFYPTKDAAFDQGSWQGEADEQDLPAFRRMCVDSMVTSLYKRVHATRPSAYLAISPQGNMEVNYNEQCCDVARWMRETGYCDLMIPQLYWGTHRHQNKSARCYLDMLEEWSALPMHEGLKLAIGLGAYRISVGDGQGEDQAEWQTGHALAAQATAASGHKAVSGIALFRYGSLFQNDAHEALARMESSALSGLLL